MEFILKLKLSIIKNINQNPSKIQHIRFVGRDMEYYHDLLLYIVKGTKLVPVNLKEMYKDRIIDIEEKWIFNKKFKHSKPRYFTNKDWAYI